MKTEQQIRVRLHTYEDLMKAWESTADKSVEENRHRDSMISVYDDCVDVLKWVLDEE